MKNEPLKFAAFIRVSTERQEQQGESLRVQKTSIERDVQALDGIITEWYGGQEHATAGWEREQLEKLLSDAQKPSCKWNAVIVAYGDRWSRDNAKSKEGIEIFKEKGIKFYIGQTEYDLFNPEHSLVLGITAEIGSFFASQQAKKSMESRIERARSGIPTTGRLPWGRTYDPLNKWGLDKEKHNQIKDVAERYLAGESIKDLADELGINNSNLHKILTKRSGTDWEVKFKLKKFKINEKITIKVPPLLSDETINAIKVKAEQNRTYSPGASKYKHLLGHFIFCGECGSTLTGQPNHKKRVYRHRRKCTLENRFPHIPAEAIEKVIITDLFQHFGNPKAIEKAIQEALPDKDKAEKLTKRKDKLLKQLETTQKGRQKVLSLVSKGITTVEEAEHLLNESKNKIIDLETKLSELTGFLDNRPTKEQIKTASQDARRALMKINVKLNAVKNIANEDINAMSWDEKRALIEAVFKGKDHNGKRYGVYMWFINKNGLKKTFRYEIHGQAIKTQGEVIEPLNSGKIQKTKKVTLSSLY